MMRGSEQKLKSWTIGRWYRRYLSIDPCPFQATAVVGKQFTGIATNEVVGGLSPPNGPSLAFGLECLKPRTSGQGSQSMTAKDNMPKPDRKREESALRYSEENYRLVVETAPDAVISIDERGAILFANPATVRIFGYDPTELIGKPLTLLMPEFLRKLHEKGFSRFLATGQRDINWQGTELTALPKSGKEFPVEISFGELSRDGHKVFTGFIRDISERKQAEELRAAHARQIAVRADVSMAF